MSATGQEAKNAKIPVEGIDEKESEKLVKSILSKDQAPTISEQTPTFEEWRRFRDELGPPFDSERVTLKQMRQIRKDPMVAFGLHYRKVPIARAEFHIEARDKNGTNYQVAAFVDACLRRVYAAYIFQRMLTLDFGFQAIVKRFQMANPGGVFADRNDLDENGIPAVKPIWDEGSVIPKIWNTFAALRPERVQPKFVESGNRAGEFDGILYEVPPQQRTRAMGFKAGRSKGNQAQRTIDIYHALWATNQKHEEHGSIYGYPLTGYARDYWWDYKMFAGLHRRGFERIALPPVKAYYPEGSTVVDPETGARRANWEIALEMAERLRMNAVVAIPSTMAEAGVGEASSTQRAWDFEYMETPSEKLNVFNEARNYFNVMKLRSVWVPEMAFIGRESGNSGGNIAGVMQEVFTSSQKLLMDEVVEEINRYLIPHLVAINFPEFVNNGGRAWMVSHGFRKEDMELLKQLIQLFGQADPAMLAAVDTEELLRRADLPLKDAEQLRIDRERMAQDLANQGPPNVPGVTIANPNVNPGSTNGGSVPEPNAAGSLAGFSDDGNWDYIYMQPMDSIDLELADVDDYLAGLPTTKHYSDKTIRALSVQLRRLWASHFRRLYPELAGQIDAIKFEFTDDDGKRYGFSGDGLVEFAEKSNGTKAAAAGVAVTFVTKKQAEKAAKSIVNNFKVSSRVMKELTEKSAAIIRKMVMRQIKIEQRETGITLDDIPEDAIDTFVTEQTGRLIKFTNKTLANEVRDHLINEIREGKTASEIADGLVSRFETMPASKAERIARSETRDAVNGATLLTGESAGVRYTQMRDGEQFDVDCKKRNGKLATIREAWKELRKEHPYGTLSFRLMPRVNFSIEWVNEIEDQPDHFAYFDDESSTAFIVRGLDDNAVDIYLESLADQLIDEGRYSVRTSA